MTSTGIRPSPKATRVRTLLPRNVDLSTQLLIVVGALAAMGLVMVGSASSVASIELFNSPWSIFIREVLWMTLGLIALFLTYRTDYRKWRNWRLVLVVATLVMLVGVLLPGISTVSGGSSRWIGFGEFRIQPSELMKLALVIFGADLLARRSERQQIDAKAAAPLLLVAGLSGLLIIMQPDMGTALVLAAIVVVLLFGGGLAFGSVLRVFVALGAVGLLFALIEPYRAARLFSFLHPGAHASGSGYQVVQSLIGLGSGHLFGLGLGSGHQKLGFLPNAQTDFIFSVIGEELGVVGTIFALGLFGALIWLGLKAALQAPDRFGSLMALGLVAWIAAETVINVGAVIGVLPVAGVPLPFISYGGSSLVITMAAAGILANIARPRGRATGGSTRRRTQVNHGR